MTGDETDNNLFRLATKCKPPAKPHLFGAQKRIPPEATATGFEQIERECKACGLNRITVMRGPGARAYRWGDAQYQFEEPVEPECQAAVEIKREAAE